MKMSQPSQKKPDPREVLNIIISLNLNFKGEGFGDYYPQNAWGWLVFCVLSLRTKDEVSQAAYRRLATEILTPEDMMTASVDRISQLIFPCGFYQRKAQQLKKIAQIIHNEYHNEPPRTQEELFKLPGVGLKTANFVLSRAYGLPAICVDIHVHRISNRLGWVKTETPEKTEKELMRIVPQDLWAPMNDLMVRFGQHICRPVSPLCTKCPLSKICPKIPFKNSVR